MTEPSLKPGSSLFPLQESRLSTFNQYMNSHQRQTHPMIVRFQGSTKILHTCFPSWLCPHFSRQTHPSLDHPIEECTQGRRCPKQRKGCNVQGHYVDNALDEWSNTTFEVGRVWTTSLETRNRRFIECFGWTLIKPPTIIHAVTDCYGQSNTLIDPRG